MRSERVALNRKDAESEASQASLGLLVVTLVSQHENHMKAPETDSGEIPVHREPWTGAVRQQRIVQRKGDESAQVALAGSKFQRIGDSIINIVKVIR